MSTVYLIDYYANNLDSPMHRASTIVKVTSTLLVLGTVIFNRSLLALFLQLLLILAFQSIARLPVKQLLLWALYPAFFAGLFALSQAQYSLQLALLTLLRAFDAAELVLLIINTTPYTRIISLTERVSKTVSNLAFFSYRFFFLFVDESSRRLTIFKARGGLEGSLGEKIRNTARLIGLLFISYMEVGEKVYEAVKTRGYRGVFSTRGTRSWTRTRYDCVPFLLVLLSLTVFFGGDMIGGILFG